MNRMRAVLILIGVLAVGSLAVAAMWQYASESAGGDTAVARSERAAASAPESRSIFPKVLNR
jgi:FtsZ-interacting cell division protein ZipA